VTEPPESLICDTARMAALTARRPATIRHLCRDLRGPAGYDYNQCLPILDAHPEEVVVLTAAEAEQYLGVKAGTVRQWVHRGLMKAVDRNGDGHPRYNSSDLQRLRARMERRAQLDL
jgi:excisionase family DNA binding protein